MSTFAFQQKPQHFEETLGAFMEHTGKTYKDLTLAEWHEWTSMPLDWHCVDCGFDTGPGCSTLHDVYAAQQAGDEKNFGSIQFVPGRTEIYTVVQEVWDASGVDGEGGCLCIGCLEKRLGRRLTPDDFDPESFAQIPPHLCSPRLAERRFSLTRAERRALKAVARKAA